IWVLSLLLWPIPLLAAWSAWQRLEPAQLESDTAVVGWSLVRGLLLPLAWIGLAQAGVLIFVLAINNFAVPSILQVKVSPAEMWIRFNTAFDTAGVMQLSWPLAILPVVLIAWFGARGVPWPHRQVSAPASLFRRQLGPTWFRTCGVITALVCFLSVGLPVLQLLTTGRTWTELPGALAAGQAACWDSFWLAALSASIVLVLALAAVGRTDSEDNRLSKALRLVVLPALWLPFLLPGVLIGIALIAVFNRPGLSFFYQSAGIIVLAFLIRYLGFGWSTIRQVTRTADPVLSDVARLEGASHWQMLRFVQWPQLGAQLAAVWYVVFLLCLWDVESMILVVPPGGETLALRIFNLLHYGHNAQVNALCLMLLALALLPLALWVAGSAVRGLCQGGTGPKLRATQSCFLALFALVPVALLGGCAPHTSATDLPVQSQIFSHVQIIGHRGVGVGELNKPRSVVVDSHDDLYVTDMTGRVQEFSSNGVFLLSWQMPQTDKGRPKGMCLDRKGDIVVNEPHYSRVNHFTATGKLIVQWGVHGTNDGQLTFPRSVAVNSRDEIYVTEYGIVERVQRFTSRGEKF
ncbi:MAG TPA: hypothetical protein VHI52_01265, partial [Verrucomicrobiae bacterium]|nr:hypothetical protein [Verrucomicrobiae bacterium]